MKTGRLLGVLTAIVAVLSISAVACSGDGGDDGTLSADEIRTQKGIVSAAGPGGGAGGDLESTDGNGLGAPAPEAASFDEGVGGERAGLDTAGGLGFAPVPFQQATGTGTGITVQGNGTATADADSANVDLWFSRFSERDVPFPEPVPAPLFDDDFDFGDADDTTSSGSSGNSGEIAVEPLPPVEFGFDDGFKQEEVAPITEEDLQPVIDAIVDAGVPRDDIEFVEQSYFDPYYASANLRVTVDNIDDVPGVIDASQEAAADLADINADGNNVSYTVGDCSTLQRAALETAIEDASDNAAIFADALGVGVGEIIGAANYSYFPNDGSACDSYFGYYYDEFGVRGSDNAEVQVYANVSVTYAIQ